MVEITVNVTRFDSAAKFNLKEDIRMDDSTASRVEQILQSKIDGTSYDKKPLSRVEELLLDLDTGGGGGTSDYNSLSNKPSLNGVTLQGNLISKDVKVESDYDVTYDPDAESVVIGPAKSQSN